MTKKPEHTAEVEGKQLGVDAESVSAGNLDVDGADYVAAGDFAQALDIQRASNVGLSNSDATTWSDSAAYVSERLRWDQHFNADQQIACALSGQTETVNADIKIRVQNRSQGETILGPITVTSSFEPFEAGPVNYTPGSLSSTDSVRVQIQTATDGSSVTLREALVVFGVQL